jgi:hypothetical protein
MLTGNFFADYRELNRAIREIFALIRESRSRPLFGSLRTLPRRRTGTPPDGRAHPSRSRARGQLLSMRKAPQACRKSLAQLVDANDRAFQASRWRRGSRHRQPGCTELHPRRGTEGSNPLSSSGESIATPDFRGRILSMTVGDFTNAPDDILRSQYRRHPATTLRRPRGLRSPVLNVH